MAIITPVLLFLAAEPWPPRDTHTHTRTRTHTHSLTHSHAHPHAAHAPPRSRPPVWERRRRSASSSPGRRAHALIHMHEEDSKEEGAEEGNGTARARQVAAVGTERAAGRWLLCRRQAACPGHPEGPSLGKQRSAGASSATWRGRSRAEVAPALPRGLSRLWAFPASPLAEGIRWSCPPASRRLFPVEGRTKPFGGRFLRCKTFPPPLAGCGRPPLPARGT